MFSENNKFRCYAHLDGHTDVCYSDDGSHLLTCGRDGDVRIWKSSAYDEDAASHRAGESVFAVACKNKKLYTAADDNSVRIHTFPDCQPDGVAVRFTAPVTHMAFNNEGSQLYAGSEDFHIKVVMLETSKQRVLLGHEAPVLSLALQPGDKYLASSSCDGTVKIWKLEDDTCVKTLHVIPKTNSFSSSLTLCRMAWTQDGKLLAVPVEKEVRMYSADTWEVAYSLTDPAIKAVVSVCCLSPCWRFITAGCRDGLILLWDIKAKKLVNKETNDDAGAITGITWRPQGECDLAYTDQTGFLGIISDFIPIELTSAKSAADVVATEYGDLFDDDMDFEDKSHPKPSTEGSDTDINKIFDDDDSKSMVSQSEAGDALTSEAPKPAPPAPRLSLATPLQPAFQPGSSPSHLTHRYMVWNSVGIIRQYNTEEENSIDIEFHDTATHHAMHVTNTLGHSMAALSDQAVLLACESDDDTPSQVVCTHFGAWDSSKEWSLAMPEGEEVEAVAIGDGWVAVGTDARRVRVLTVGGVQRDVFTLPGPVVCLSGHGQHLLAVYHRAQGLPGDQCLDACLVNLTGRSTRHHNIPLPLSPKSTLTWAGFSAEGTPFITDSTGALLMLNRRLGSVWTQVSDTKSLCKGKSDYYWIVGLHENPAQIRAIHCKGSRYPPTLPRPNVNILPYQLPLCELSTDKGQLEESYWRSCMLTGHLDHWAAQGYEVDETTRARANMSQQEMLIKLFALACKTGRETRAEEIARLMSGQQAVQLVIKYASRLRKMQLAQKLTDIARAKAEEEEAGEQGEQDDDAEENGEECQPAVIKRTIQKKHRARRDQEDEEEEGEGEDELGGDDTQDMDEEGEEAHDEEKKTLLLKFGQKPEKQLKSLGASQGRANPFKVQSQTAVSTKGSSVFDKMSPQRKNRRQLPEPSRNQRTGLDAFKPTQKKISTQSTLKGKKVTEKSQENEDVQPGRTAFQVWMSENEAALQEEHPDTEPSELVLIAARAFKLLSAEQKQELQQKAKGTTESNDSSTDHDTSATSGEKRKREAEDSVSSGKTKKVKDTTASPVVEKKRPLANGTNAKPLATNTNTKLATFSFGK